MDDETLEAMRRDFEADQVDAYHEHRNAQLRLEARDQLMAAAAGMFAALDGYRDTDHISIDVATIRAIALTYQNVAALITDHHA